MSKNPPKPNTSPDHVKETAETFTCPSHIEARERLYQWAIGALEGWQGLDLHLAESRQTLAQYFAANLPRTLLATPTQGRDRYATEEEICRIVREVYDAGAKGAERGATFVKAECDLLALHGIDGLNSDADVPAPTQEGVGREEIAENLRGVLLEIAREVDRVDLTSAYERRFLAERLTPTVISLLPAPKPPQPAPGAPEGWREAAARIIDPLAWEICDNGDDGALIGITTDVSLSKADRIAALTSSSAKPVEGDRSAI